MFKDSVASLLLLASLLALAAGEHLFCGILLILAAKAYFIGQQSTYPLRIQKALNFLGMRLIQGVILLVTALYLIVAVTNLGASDAAAFVTGLVLSLTPLPILISARWYTTKKAPALTEHNALHAIRSCLVALAGSSLLLIISAIGLLGFHIINALQPAQLLIAILVLHAPIWALAQDKARHKLPKETAATVRQRLIGRHSLSNYLGSGAIIASLTYINYLLFYARHALSPYYLDTSLPMYQQATTLSLLTLLTLFCIHILFERSDRHDFFLTDHIWHNKRLLQSFVVNALAVVLIAYVPWLQSLFNTAGLDAVDWLLAVFMAIVYTALRGTHRHSRKHSRRAVLALHHEIHNR